jgi:hypothetical protein
VAVRVVSCHARREKGGSVHRMLHIDIFVRMPFFCNYVWVILATAADHKCSNVM